MAVFGFCFQCLNWTPADKCERCNAVLPRIDPSSVRGFTFIGQPDGSIVVKAPEDNWPDEIEYDKERSR